MSSELQEVVATLQEEKVRYDQLIATSMGKLNELRTSISEELTEDTDSEVAQMIQQMEAEIKMLRSLVDHIYFKLKILSINHHAS